MHVKYFFIDTEIIYGIAKTKNEYSLKITISNVRATSRYIDYSLYQIRMFD